MILMTNSVMVESAKSKMIRTQEQVKNRIKQLHKKQQKLKEAQSFLDFPDLDIESELEDIEEELWELEQSLEE